MSARRTPCVAIAVLAVSHGLVLLAGFAAPYNPAAQDRELPFAPPTRIHFLDKQGKLHPRPFVYRWKASPESDAGYREDASVVYPIRLLAPGPQYALIGGLVSRTHLFETDDPAKIFLIGSDAYGRDQFSRFLYGGRISLFAGLLATAVSLSLGILFGGMAGFYGGWLDELIMRAAEIFLALPWLYLLFAVRACLPLHIAPDRVFLLTITVIGVIGWARPARLIRGVVLAARERGYVLAAKAFGASDIYLLRRHVLPQALNVALTQAAVFIPAYVLAEVILSFFGLGVGEPAASWGNLLANLRQYDVLDSYWWMFLPAVALVPIFLAYYRLFSYYGYYFGDNTVAGELTKIRMSFEAR